MKLFKIFSTFFVSFLLIETRANVVAASAASGYLETLEQFLDNEVITNVLPKSKAVGLGLTVANGNGSFVYSKGFGLRDVEANDSATSKSLFGIGSVTKSFTSVLAVKILSEKFPQFGELVLDIPINTLDPSLNFTLSDRYRTESVSFKDLLAHRTCLTSHTSGVTYGVIKDIEEFLYRSRYESEVCPFRAGFVYNNVMYGVAGRLIGQIAGDSYENLMRKFLDDLGMMDSRLLTLEEDFDNLDTLMQSYYVDGEGTLKKSSANLLKQVALAAPAGALLSTAEDMAKYIHFHLNGGQSIVGDVQVVPKEVMDWMSHSAIIAEDSVTYGLGFFLVNMPGYSPLLNHGGYIMPFASDFTIIPGLNIGIFMSTNGPGTDTPVAAQAEFRNQIIDFVLSQSPPAEGGVEHMVRSAVKQIPRSNHRTKASLTSSKNVIITNGSKYEKKFRAPAASACNLTDVVGHFGHAVEGDMEFWVDGVSDGLKLKFGIWGLANLYQIDDVEEECKFDIEVTTDAVAHLYSAMDGGVVVNQIGFQRSEVDGSWETAVWEVGQGQFIRFRRNLSIGNLPEIPYDADSCVAENSYD